MSSLSRIYAKTPIIMQNIMLSGYGLYLARKRYPKKKKIYLTKIKQLERMSREEIRAYETEKLMEVVRYAYVKVPYYKDLFKRMGFDPLTVHSWDRFESYFRGIPILEKQDVVQGGSRFISDDYLTKELLKYKTSGSTGTPLELYRDKECNYSAFMYWEMLRNNHGVGLGDRKATFFAREVVPKYQTTPPFWRHNVFQKQLLFSIYHMSHDTIPLYVEQLEKFNPKYIECYPSALYIMAQFMDAHDLELRSDLEVIFCTAENLDAKMRNLIERKFRAKVINQYGANEVVVFAGDCQHKNLHIYPGYGYTEVLDPSGLETDGPGEIIATSFLNRAMPLIRYRLGDIVSISDTYECACGRKSKVITQIDGRKDDVIVTPDGTHVTRIGSFIRDIENVRESQVIQIDLNNILVKVVLQDKNTFTDKAKIINALRSKLGENILIHCEFVDDIERQPNGKFRNIVSYLSSEDKRNVRNGNQRHEA